MTLNFKCAGFGNVCVKFGTFVCDLCKTSHQAVSHRVKSVTMSTWTLEEVEALTPPLGGNELVERTWLGKAPPPGGRYPQGKGQRPKQGDDIHIFKQFVIDAYENQLFRVEASSISPSEVVPSSAEVASVTAQISLLDLAPVASPSASSSQSLFLHPPLEPVRASLHDPFNPVFPAAHSSQSPVSVFAPVNTTSSSTSSSIPDDFFSSAAKDDFWDQKPLQHPSISSVFPELNAKDDDGFGEFTSSSSLPSSSTSFASLAASEGSGVPVIAPAATSAKKTLNLDELYASSPTPAVYASYSPPTGFNQMSAPNPISNLMSFGEEHLQKPYMNGNSSGFGGPTL